MIDVWQYYGLDWISMLLGFAGTYALGNQSRGGFVLIAFGTVCAMGVAIFIGSIPFLIANITTILLNMRAYQKWKKKGRQSDLLPYTVDSDLYGYEE